MTKIELFTAIANRTEITDEMVELAQHLVEADAAAKAKAKEKRANADPTQSKSYQENLPLVTQVVEYITAEGTKTTSEVAAFLEVKGPKATAVLKQGVKMGLLVQGETKLPKVGVRKTYSLA